MKFPDATCICCMAYPFIVVSAYKTGLAKLLRTFFYWFVCVKDLLEHLTLESRAHQIRK